MEDPDLQRHEVPAAEFVTGARAWKLAREDPALAQRCVYGKQLRGPEALRLNLVRDFAAVNGFPDVSGDSWGLGPVVEGALGAADRRILDRVADVCGVDGELAEQRGRYATAPGLAPPDTLRHFEGRPEGGRDVRWRDEP